MTKIKFCGLTGAEDIAAANILLPDYIGFVFAASKRQISPAVAAELKKALHPAIKAVGVFANETVQTVAAAARRNIIDAIQLHGTEDDAYIEELRRLTDKKIIKAFVVKNSADAASARTSLADAVLLDAGKGAGLAFDWSLAQNFPRPFFLAGGLSPENVRRAIETTRPFAVDVSSGIESAGRKDFAKMKKFIEAAKEAHYAEQ